MTAKKHDGSKGAAWEKWKTEYLDAAAGKGDDMASWADTFNGTDQQVGLTAAQVRARTKRRREAYSSLLLHLDDEGLKATIRAEAGGAANATQRRSEKVRFVKEAHRSLNGFRHETARKETERKLRTYLSSSIEVP